MTMTSEYEDRAVRAEGQVEMSMHRVSAMVEGLHERVTTLSKVMESSLRPSAPTAMPDSRDLDAVVSMPRSPLAERFGVVLSELERLASRLDDLTNRVDL